MEKIPDLLIYELQCIYSQSAAHTEKEKVEECSWKGGEGVRV